MERAAFLTGSRAYGKIGPSSDTDLVVFVTDEKTIRVLKEQADPSSPGLYATDTDRLHDRRKSFSLRFGKLNLIVCTDRERFNDWQWGTKRLTEIAPVNREHAVTLFSKLFEKKIRRDEGD